MIEWKKPCDELPEIEKRVLVAVKYDFRKTIVMAIAGHIPRHSIIAEDFLSEDDLDYGFVDTAENGTEYVPAGWYELCPVDGETVSLLAGEVVYWCEIPTPPDCF